MTPNDIYVKDPVTNEIVLFATAQYDPSADKIYFKLTDYIENKAKVDFGFIRGWEPEEWYALYNQPYNYTFSVGKNSISKNLITNGRANARHIDSKILYLNPRDGYKYQQVAVFNPGHLADGFRVVYIGDTHKPNQPTTPIAPDGKMTIYKIPDDYHFPDSFHVDPTKLIDVTDTFTKLNENGTIVYENYSPSDGRYVILLENRYNPDEAFNSGFMFPTSKDHPFYGEWTGNTYDKVGLPSWVGTVANNGKPIFCRKDVVIKKVDKETGKALANAVFEIYSQKTNELMGKVTTDDNGVGKIRLPIGSYTLKEIEAPKGYKQLTSDISFDITKDGPLEVIAENEKLPEEPTADEPKDPEAPKPTKISKTPKTGDSNDLYMLFGIAGLSILGIVLNRKKINK